MEKVTRAGVKTPKAEKATYAFPTEVIDLPSLGRLYPEGHALSSGNIEIKYMTAREEDILTSQNLINKGIVLDKLLESVIVTDVDVDDLVVGDKNAILLASRILAYGPDYDSRITCPSCNTVNEVSVDLSVLENKDVELLDGNGNSFGFKLPQSGVEITFKILTHGDIRKIQNEIDTWEKLGNEVRAEMSIRYKFMITSVGGNTSKAYIKEFVRNGFTMQDSSALKEHIFDMSPGIDQTFDFGCQRCDYTERLKIPFGIDFFWPSI